MQGVFFFQIDDASALDVVDLAGCGCTVLVLKRFDTADLLMHASGPVPADTHQVQVIEVDLPTGPTQSVESVPVDGSVEFAETAGGTKNVTHLFTTGQGAYSTKMYPETQDSGINQDGDQVHVGYPCTSV